ncbi:hypothetical protein ACWDRR_09815 [Kitasatospora sp. NPDC003701]
MADFDTAEAVLLLRRLAEDSSGLITLDPGIDDDVLDGWPVPVPEAIRVLLRAVAGVRITVARSEVNGHTSYEHLDFVHPYNEGRYHGHDTSWYLDHVGGAGSHWFVHTDHGDGHTYVDVDRDTGGWGPVFRFWDDTDTVRVAPSLPVWLQEFADCARRALVETGTLTTATGGTAPGAAAIRAFGSSFAEHWTALDAKPAAVRPVTVPEARSATDPVLRAAAADLPDDALLADLRPVTGPARVHFPFPVSCQYARRHGGTVLIATPWDGE